MEDEDGKQVVYLVDRNYMFMRYDINNFTEKQVNRDFSFPLNRTILNNTCSDLQREQPYNNITIILCQTVTFNDQGERKVLNTIVQMDNLTNNGTPVARYLSYTQNRVILDPSVSFTYMGIEIKILSILKTSL